MSKIRLYETAIPDTPPADSVEIFYEPGTPGTLKVKKDDASVVSLEAGAAGGTPVQVNTGGTLAGADFQDTANVKWTEGAGVVTANLNSYLDLAEIGTPGTPAANDLRIWVEDRLGASMLRIKGDDGITLDLAQDRVVMMRNETGVTIPLFSVVYESGVGAGGEPLMALAKADSESTMPAVGITLSAVGNNANGRVMIKGVITGLNLSGFSVGDITYVSAATAGLTTTTPPAHPNLRQRIARVLSNDAVNGVALIVDRADRGTEIGTRSNTFSIGDDTAGAKDVILRNGFDLTLRGNPTADRTVTLPDATGTLLYGGGPLGTPASGTLSSCDAFTGDAGAGGVAGIVPAPGVGDATKYLKGDGTWAAVAGGTEVNDLATDGIQGIADDQLAVGTGPGTAAYQTLPTGAVSYNPATGAFAQASSANLSDGPFLTAEVNALAADGISGIADDQLAVGTGPGTAAYQTLPNGAVAYSTSAGTFSQAGTAGLSDGSAVVKNNQGNTYSTGTQDFQAATLQARDSTFEIRDNTTPTKVAKFECSSITAATTKTFTFPDSDGTLVLELNSANLENKTIAGCSLSSNNIITSLDSNFTLQDNVTPTKQAKFECSGITAATTRTYTLPDASGTLLYSGGPLGTPLTGTLTNCTGLPTGGLLDDAVTYAKLQNVSAQNRLLGRISTGAGDAEELTGTQATTLLDAFTSLLQGVVPASGGGTTNFLRADGTWAAPAGGGDVVGPASATDSVPALFDGTTGKLIKNSTPTGTGNPVLATSPTLTTPNVGVASATSINKVAITAPATSSTLTIVDGATLTASATATVSGTNTGDQSTIAAVTVADESTDTTCFPLFVTAATGDLGPKSNAALTFNSATASLGCTTFVGNLTGDITGNAATVTTNANLTGPITSVGNATTVADAELAALAGLTSAADKVPYFTGSGTAAVADFTAAGRALVDDADAAAQRATLGLTEANIEFVIDGGGSAITAGNKGHLEVPFACTVVGWTVIADQSGSIVVDVKRATYADFPTTASIAGSEKPTLTTAQKNQDLTLTTWSGGGALAKGDILEFVAEATPATVTRVTVSLRVTR